MAIKQIILQTFSYRLGKVTIFKIIEKKIVKLVLKYGSIIIIRYMIIYYNKFKEKENKTIK